MAVEIIPERESEGTAITNYAEPYWIDYITCLLAKELGTSISEIKEMPYTIVIRYTHCVMRLEGNKTRWVVVDGQQADVDLQAVNDLLG